MTAHQIGSGRPLFTITDFRAWAANGAPRINQAAKEERK